MNAIERGQLLDDLQGRVQGGVAETLQNILDVMGYEIEELDRHTLAAIDEHFFCCDQCNWTMPVDELSETESGDGFLCKECDHDNSAIVP